MAGKSSKYISVEEAAKRLGISGRQVRNMIPDTLPAMQVGRAYVIAESDLAKVPKDRKRGPKPKK